MVAEDGSREFPLPRKTLNILGYLILKSKRPPTRDAVAFALFPDEDEEKARSSLRRNLSYLLQALPSTNGGEPFVRIDGERLAWNVAAPAHVDVLAFERAVAEGRDDDALAEYAGPLLPTLYDEWTTADRERLREEANAALARTIERDRSLRRFDAATKSARRLLEDDPWREDIVRQLMSVRYEAGDRAGALAVFGQFSLRMRDEMDAEPMAETLALRDAILRGARLASSEPAAGKRALFAHALPFVGRDDAMTRAIERWHESADGRAGALFIAGEAGIGKSRFAAELARAIEREGGITVIGETAAGGERRPYEAVIEALRYAPAVRSSDAGRRSDTWVNLVEQILDEHSLVTLDDERSARVRLFGTIHKAVRELARARPLVVVLEDLHWAGPTTIELLGFLLQRLATAPVLVVGTYRDDELPRPHPLRALVRDVERSGRATRLTLSRLTESDATHAISAAGPANLTGEVLAAAVAWSDGVPLMLSEAVRDIAAGREFSGGSLLDVIDERLARLGSEAETTLAYAAVLGARFELETLAAVTGWRDDELVEALAPALELGLIRADSRSRSRSLTFAFSHHVIHAATLARIAESDRARAHGLVARVLCTLFAGAERALEIAQHYAAGGDARRAAEQYAVGARYALDVFANVDARDAATAGIALATAAPEDRELRYDLIATRERALARLGADAERRADAELMCELSGDDEVRLCAALERLIEALRHDLPAQSAAFANLELQARRSVRAAATFERTVAAERLWRGDFQAASEAAERAARHFDALGDRDAALRAQLQRVNALSFLGDPTVASDIIASLRPVAEACDDLSLRMEFYLAAVTATFAAPGTESERALADAERSLELALLIGDRLSEALARQNLGFAFGRIGDSARSVSEWERAIQIYSEIGIPATMALLNLASTLGWFGDFDGAFRLLDELEALAITDPWVVLQGETHRATTHFRAGQLDIAERYFLAAHEHAQQLGIAAYAARIRVFMGEIEAQRGHLEKARVELDAATAALERLKMGLAVAEAQALSARLYVEMGNVPAARESIAAAVAAVVDIPERELSTKYWWDLTAASALLGDEPAAREFAERAARLFCAEALVMPPDLAESYSRLPWLIDTFAYLAGREVPLTLAGTAHDEPAMIACEM